MVCTVAYNITMLQVIILPMACYSVPMYQVIQC